MPRLDVCDAEGRRFVSLDGAGQATGYCGHVDLGQGIGVALTQILAEELNLPLSHARMVLGDTDRTPDQGPTIASETIQVSARPLRAAAATLRAELLARAARQFNAPSQEVALRNGAAFHADREIAIGSLLREGEEPLEIDWDARLKDPADYTIVGHRTGRLDLPEKARGSFQFIHDVTVEGMLHGHVIRPPYVGRDSGPFVGHSLIGYDEEVIADQDGFVAVVREGDLLAVVATRPDIAQALAERLPVHWRMPPPLPDMDDLGSTIRDQPSTARVLDSTGDFGSGLADCDTQAKRSYVWPYQLHGSIGPSCAVADWRAGAPVVWCGSQNPHMLRADLATLTGLSAEDIDVRRYQAAGCYGRNCADDVAGDALILSRAVGRPVRVQLTRKQETLWEPKGSAQIMDVEGGIREGRLHAYAIDTWYPSNRGPNLALLLTGAISNAPQPVEMGDRTVIPPYTIPNKRITVHDLAPIVRAAWFRGVSALPNTFAHECFVDEMAQAAEADPVQFRLDHIDDPRVADLIRRTADAAGWEARAKPRLRREGRMAYGQGFAYATYVHGNFPGVAAAAAAWICDVAIDTQTGEVTLTRVFVGQDQGLVINPDGVRQQIHGNVHQTAGRVLSEEVTFDSIQPTQQSWANYPVMTFPETPEIDTMLIERPGDPPLGVGESAAVPSAAAIASAIYDATGVRLREVPFTPERMREGLRAAGYEVTDERASPAGGSRRLRGGLLALGAALTAGTVGLSLNRAIPAASPPPTSSYSTALLEQGRQVFAAGNCITCHTTAVGQPGAGGRAFETPFGTIYSTNITPDPETGLGKWSFAAFDRAMRQGISRDGSHLYPVFPYTAFSGISEADMHALYAYVQSRDPVRQETQPAQMIMPANIRATNAGWNLLFHRDAAPLSTDPTRSDTWNRGRYLVETVGHCSACHSPRNPLGAERGADKHLAGAVVNGWYAPPLAGMAAGERGWDEASLTAYLSDGHAADMATAAGPMAEVVSNLRDLPQADISAMAVYLSDLMEGETSVPSSPAVPPQDLATIPGHRLFETACASCHEPAMPETVTAAQVSLARSMAVRAPTIETVDTIIREGLRAPDNLRLRDMPAYGDEFTDAQIETLSRYLRERYAPELPSWPTD